LTAAISIAVDRIHRGFEPLKKKVKRMHEHSLQDEAARLLIYEAFMDQKIKGIPRQIMPLVHDRYFHPEHGAFYPRNLWSLSNAFTSAFKKLSPVKQFEVTARLGTFLTGIQDGSNPATQILSIPVESENGVGFSGQPVITLAPSLAAQVQSVEVSASSNNGTEKEMFNDEIENYSFEDDNDNYRNDEESDASDLKELEEELDKEYLQKIS
jgi:hypothetical protein